MTDTIEEDKRRIPYKSNIQKTLKNTFDLYYAIAIQRIQNEEEDKDK